MIRAFAIAIAPLLMAYSTGSSLPAVGSEGDVLTVSSGAWTSAAASGGGWTSVYEYDFTSEATNDWCGGDGCSSADDGAVSLDGNSWTLAITGTPTKCQVTNGTGIELTTGSGNTCNVGIAVNAGLGTSIKYWTQTMRVWLYATFTAPSVNSKSLWLRVSDSNTALFGTPTCFDHYLFRRQETGPTQGWYPYLGGSNSSSGCGATFAYTSVTSYGTTTNLTHDVMVIEAGTDRYDTRMYTGSYSAGWPTTLTPRLSYSARDARATALNSAGVSGDMTDYDISFGTDEPAIVVKAIKIETRQ